MESANEIGSHAMTPEERDYRLSRLEKWTRNFSIVVAGAHVEGEFGHLPKSDQQLERISNLEKSVEKFRLVGSDVEVSGSFEKGFVIDSK